MPLPVLSQVAQRLYEGLEPLAYADADHDYALAHFAQALAKMVDEVADLSRDGEDDSPGWSVLFDPDAVPAKLLPWLAQFVGVTIPSGLDEAAQRARLRSTDGFRRGTASAIVGAAQQHLTGAQTVYLTERHGSAYRLTVATLLSETPDSDLDRTNLVTNPSFEGGAVTGYTKSASTAGDPAATLTATQDWAKSGTWSARYTVTHNDAVAVVVRTLTGASGIPVTAGKWYGFRGSTRIRVPQAGAATIRAAIYWWDATGAASSVQVSSLAGLVPTTVAGEYEVMIARQAPSDAAFASVGIIFDSDVAYSVDADVDDFAFYEVFANMADDDVPAYGDGSLPGWAWDGTANASTSTRTPTTIVRDAVEAQKPGGLVLTFSIVPGGDFDTLRDTHTDFDDVTATFATFNDARDNPALQ